MRRSFVTALFLMVSLVGFTTDLWPNEPSKIKKLKDLNRRAQHPLGINAYAFGPVGLFAATADWFITPKLALELGGGVRDFEMNNAFTIGGRYHIFGNSFLNMTPYIGVYSAFHYNGAGLQSNSLYIPFGIHKIKKNKLSWSVEMAYQRNTFFNNRWSGGLRLGYRF